MVQNHTQVMVQNVQSLIALQIKSLRLTIRLGSTIHQIMLIEPTRLG